MGKTALIVDDGLMNLKLLDALIREHGIECEWAKSGEEAILKVREGLFDIIFMDQMMPEYDGNEATKEIRGMKGTYYENVPTIAMTNTQVLNSIDEWIQLGYSDVLTKPVTRQGIQDILSRWITV